MRFFFLLFKPFVIWNFFHVCLFLPIFQMQAGLDLVYDMSVVGLTLLSLEALDFVLHATERSHDFQFVRYIIHSISFLSKTKGKNVCSCCALLSNSDFNKFTLKSYIILMSKCRLKTSFCS